LKLVIYFSLKNKLCCMSSHISSSLRERDNTALEFRACGREEIEIDQADGCGRLDGFDLVRTTFRLSHYTRSNSFWLAWPPRTSSEPFSPKLRLIQRALREWAAKHGIWRGQSQRHHIPLTTIKIKTIADHRIKKNKLWDKLI
jgi:hypothetical protein